MDKALLDINVWDSLNSSERENIGKNYDLPLDLKFQKLKRYQQGGQSHEIAFYENIDGVFALIIGGKAQLGQDFSKFFNLTIFVIFV